MNEIRDARAIAAFKLMGPGEGFLQPVFAGQHGDNQNYIQVLRHPSTIERFEAIIWPDRDCFMIEEEVAASKGDESVWGFQFEGEPPLIRKWSEFCDQMVERIDSGQLADKTLLQFDIVDTLDLKRLKPKVYSAAFNRYLNLSRTAATSWRERAILEPAFEEALRSWAREFSPEFGTGLDKAPRARVRNGQVHVTVGSEEAGIEDALTRALKALKADYSEIFADLSEIVIDQPNRPERTAKMRAPVLVVLVGRIAEGAVNHQRWASFGMEVVAVDHFHPRLRTGRRPELTVLVSAEADWLEVVEAQQRVEKQETILVTMSTTVGSTMRDLEFQERVARPTIKFFAPYSTSRAAGRDPLTPIGPLLQSLTSEVLNRPSERPVAAEHSLFIRETMKGRQDAVEFCCRLGARALKSGAVLEGSARIYSRGDAGDDLHAAWARLLSPLFNIEPDDRGIRSSSPRSTLLMLVERISEQHAWDTRDMLRAGAIRLLQMRGWRIVREEGDYLTVTDEQREFQVAFSDGNDQFPVEDTGAKTPGFGRSRLLVIHFDSNRERLLVGNSGQFFHIALEDIAMMEPQTDWVWPILERQLLATKRNPSLAALRLCAGLVVEAIRLGRVQTSFVDVDWNEVTSLAGEKDCERFLHFHPRGIEKRTAFVVIPKVKLTDGTRRRPGILKLTLEPEGPIVSAAVDFV